MSFALKSRVLKEPSPETIDQYLFNEDRQEAEVSVAHFAAICGMTREDYLYKTFDLILLGKPARIMKEAAQEDFLTWLINRVERGESKVLLFVRLSLNRKRDVGVYFLLDLISMDKFPDIKVEEMVVGFAERPPEGFDKLDVFEVSFCDLETDLNKKEKL